METKEILQLQLSWLNKLQQISKRPILIKALEGKIPKELRGTNADRMYRWMYYKDVWSMLQTPYFTRSILPNEIVIDPDTQNWDDVKTEYDKIIITLKRLKIPYLLAYTGGKGCHIHIFFDLLSIKIPDELFLRAKESNYDLYKAFRQHVFGYIIKESGASVELLKIDKPKLNWQIYSMGSQVRDFGTVRNGGFCKTLIEEVPKNRPLAPLPLTFPQYVEQWKIPEEQIEQIINKIKTGIAKQTKYNKQTFPTNHTIRKLDELPCISLIMKGMDSGRYYGAGAIALAGKEIGYKWEELEPLIEGYLGKCAGLNNSDVLLRVENAQHLFESEKKFSCKWVKENLKCPKPSECILTISRKEQRDTESDVNFVAIAESIMAATKFVTISETNEVLYYNEGIYANNGEVFIKVESQKAFNDITSHAVSEVVNHIRRNTYKTIAQIDSNEECVVTENGVFDFRKMELSKHSHDKVFLTKLPVKYDSTATCPKIDKFFSEITASEKDILAIEEFFGYCLLRDYPIEKSFMLVGDGRNGKSTLLRLLKTFLGSNAVSSISLQEIGENRFAAANLFGKLANTYADLSTEALKETGKMKMLAGNDNMTVEKKFGGYITFTSYAKLIFSTNRIPFTYDESDAFFSRWVIINFPNQFITNADRKLISKLTSEQELSGLLNKAVSGLKRLLINGEFSNNKPIEEVREQYIRMSDSVQAFIYDCIIPSSEDEIVKKELVEAYRVYCKSKNIPSVSDKNFFRAFPIHIRIEEYRPQRDGQRVIVFKGIRLSLEGLQSYVRGNTDIGATMSPMSPILPYRGLYGDKNSKVNNELPEDYRGKPLTSLPSLSSQPNQKWTNLEYIRNKLLTEIINFPEGVPEHIVWGLASVSGLDEQSVKNDIQRLVERGDIQVMRIREDGVRLLRWIEK